MKEKGREYEDVLGSIRDMKSKEELFNMIDLLKGKGLYDECHPYFVEESPFYLSTTEEQFLEVSKPSEIDEQGLSFLEIN